MDPSRSILHDQDRSSVDQHIAALDPFRTPSHWLPHDPDNKDAPVLPKLLIAPLEAGGPPLLSTPNIPHLVITVQDCVMVEQVRGEYCDVAPRRRGAVSTALNARSVAVCFHSAVSACSVWTRLPTFCIARAGGPSRPCSTTLCSWWVGPCIAAAHCPQREES